MQFYETNKKKKNKKAQIISLGKHFNGLNNMIKLSTLCNRYMCILFCGRLKPNEKILNKKIQLIKNVKSDKYVNLFVVKVNSFIIIIIFFLFFIDQNQLSVNILLLC